MPANLPKSPKKRIRNGSQVNAIACLPASKFQAFQAFLAFQGD